LLLCQREVHVASTSFWANPSLSSAEYGLPSYHLNRPLAVTFRAFQVLSILTSFDTPESSCKLKLLSPTMPIPTIAGIWLISWISMRVTQWAVARPCPMRLRPIFHPNWHADPLHSACCVT